MYNPFNIAPLLDSGFNATTWDENTHMTDSEFEETFGPFIAQQNPHFLVNSKGDAEHIAD